ncbi:class I SAM-dependent methyltransferase [Atopomonas sediminilitoris]|uniref:class I SAM-dependent methyltransferase n=1 Tax=Atopomonas sediminilitoris TaxID=2919919 RepID=UPI001F4D48AC|nr:methyltransferase domain-containing protein [Atopomonas sediminilitoris]MCJ8168017.1 class I SAM-dependent methyltransferase [Atopomonas sediminilitoris]
MPSFQPHADFMAIQHDALLEARRWFAGSTGQQLWRAEQQQLQAMLESLFGSYWVHYGPCHGLALEAQQLRRRISLGPQGMAAEIICTEQAWPVLEHGVDMVLLQHGLDFSPAPHTLLREAARVVRPGGHLLVLGFNPWSLWGLQHRWRQRPFVGLKPVSQNRLVDWLHLLGFAVEKRRFGCYCPPLSDPRWQQRLSLLEPIGARLALPGAGFYVLQARKLMSGLRPLRQPRSGKVVTLMPMPVARTNRRQNNSADPS